MLVKVIAYTALVLVCALILAFVPWLIWRLS